MASLNDELHTHMNVKPEVAVIAHDIISIEKLHIIASATSHWDLQAVWTQTKSSYHSIYMFRQQETNEIEMIRVFRPLQSTGAVLSCARSTLEQAGGSWKIQITNNIEMLFKYSMEIDGLKSKLEDSERMLETKKSEIEREKIETHKYHLMTIGLGVGLGLWLTASVSLILIHSCKREKQTPQPNEVSRMKSLRTENQRPAILVDECEKYGMSEIYDVTAGEGDDLVRIARPLETAGASRKLSEELLDIQPIYQDQEGRKPSELHRTSHGGTEGGITRDDDVQSEHQLAAELSRNLSVEVYVQ